LKLRCPNCQSALADGSTLYRCPNCGADLSKLLTPLETGLMTDMGIALLVGATSLLFAITLLAHVKEFRSPIFVAIIVFGLSFTAWAKAKSLTAKERFVWERFLIFAFCASAVAFWTVLMGLNWVWAITGACVGIIVGYLLCRYYEKQWRKERKR